MTSLIFDNIPFPRQELEDPTYSIALGRFMTAWGQVETLCRFLFKNLLNIDSDISIIVFDRIGTREQIEIITELVELIVDDTLRQSLTVLLGKVSDASKKRNKIAHSRWGQIDGNAARFWYGLTDANIAEISEDTPKGRALRANRIFTLGEMEDISIECITLRDALITSLATLNGIHFAPLLQDGARMSDLRGRRHGALREQ